MKSLKIPIRFSYLNVYLLHQKQTFIFHKSMDSLKMNKKNKPDTKLKQNLRFFNLKFLHSIYCSIFRTFFLSFLSYLECIYNAKVMRERT